MTHPSFSPQENIVFSVGEQHQRDHPLTAAMSRPHRNGFVPNGASSENVGDKGEKHLSSCSRIRSFDSLRWLEYGSEEEEMRWLIRCVEAAGKGFSIGIGLKGGLALFSILARLRSRRSRYKIFIISFVNFNLSFF